MDKHGIFTGPGEIRFERLLPASIETVWTFLTDPERRGQWLAPGKMELKVGGGVQLDFHHADLSPQKKEVIPEKYKEYEKRHSVLGKVTACDPPRLLSYTWGESDGAASEVTFELTPQNEQTLLILTHRRLGDKRDTLLSVASGWHTHLGILSDRLHGVAPKGFWHVHAQMEEEYSARLKDLI